MAGRGTEGRGARGERGVSPRAWECWAEDYQNKLRPRLAKMRNACISVTAEATPATRSSSSATQAPMPQLASSSDATGKKRCSHRHPRQKATR